MNQSFIDWMRQNNKSGNLGSLFGEYQKSIYDDALSKAQETGDYLGMQSTIANTGLTIDPFTEKWLDNMISKQNTGDAQSYETMMRDSELTSTANQLTSLGLNPASVVSMGRGAVPNVEAADNVKSNVAAQRIAQKQEMTKAVLGLIGHMSSAGIGGASIGLARGIGSKMASSTVQSMKEQFESLKDRHARLKYDLIREEAQRLLNRG